MLSGAVYSIYDDGKLVDSYTTDKNGSFITKEYICVAHWTLKEISPSEGYLLDKTIHKTGAEPKHYMLENNAISMTGEEKIIKEKEQLLSIWMMVQYRLEPPR